MDLQLGALSMSYPISLNQKIGQEQSLKQTQRLMMSPEMQQAIHFLQMPVQELSTLIEAEMEQNPVLEYEDEPLQEEEWEETSEEEKEMEFDENNFEILKQLDEDFRDYFAESGSPNYRSNEEEKRKSYVESSIQDKPSLFDFLMSQAREMFSTKKEMQIAEAIIGYLDDKGFLKNSLKEIAAIFSFNESELEDVLKIVQTFEPSGVGATSLQESLLIQLKNLKKENSLAFKILKYHFENLLHNKIPIIRKDLDCTAEEIRKAIDENIAKLDLNPGTSYSNEIVPYIVPDVKIRQEGEELKVEVNEDFGSPLRLNAKYLHLLDDPNLPEETKHFIKLKILSARWLIKNICQRNETLKRIAESLSKRQKIFFMQLEGKLVPLTMKALAQELDLHESTIARAVANKYIDTPRGLFPIRYFFSSTYISNSGEDISAKTVKEVLADIVKNEDKRKPLSDQSISKLIKLRGISCARRTVAKYRAELNIGNASQRKKF